LPTPIANIFRSSAIGRAIAEPTPAPAYLFPESISTPSPGSASSLEAFVFQYWPESLEDSYNVEYGSRQAFGGSHSLLQWTGGTSRDITFTARFTAEVSRVYELGHSALVGTSTSARYSVNCKAALDMIRSFMLPSYGGGRGNINNLAHPPKRLYLVLEGTGLGGGGEDAVLCVLRSAPITYEAWFPSGEPRIVEAALSFTQVVQSTPVEGASAITYQDRQPLETYGKQNYRYRGAVDKGLG